MRLETRRIFLRRSVGVAVAAPIGFALCRELRANAGAEGLPPYARRKLLAAVPFVDEGDFPLGAVVGSGLGGRLALDLSTLTPDTLITPNERFFIRTLCPDQLRFNGSWMISVRGLVQAPMELPLEDLAPHAVPLGTHLIECAGNTREGHYGLISAAKWTGIPISKVLEKVRILPRATRVLIGGFDKHSQPDSGSLPGASWIFTLEQLQASGAFLATRMNGAPLPKDHGYPLRLVVPGWYGCACIKWVNEIELLDDEAPATGQMWEYAGRTHQDAFRSSAFGATRAFERSFQPLLARDFKPASIDLAAAPVRVEKWLVEGERVYQVAGILWGGDRLTKTLVIRFNPDARFMPVEDYAHKTNATWTLWSHTFRPDAPGRYRIQLAVSGEPVRTRRLDTGFYARTIDITEV